MRSMIVWINGGFGSGKTTLVEEIVRKRPDAVVLDPELIGFVLRQTVAVPTDDFQDLPSWREIVVAAVLSVHHHHADLLLVPMTLIDETYRREVLGPLRGGGDDFLEVFLEVPEEELARRIQGRVLFARDPARDSDARAFCLSKIHEASARAGQLESDVLILQAGQCSPSQLADQVLARIAQRGAVAGQSTEQTRSHGGSAR